MIDKKIEEKINNQKLSQKDLEKLYKLFKNKKEIKFDILTKLRKIIGSKSKIKKITDNDIKCFKEYMNSFNENKNNNSDGFVEKIENNENVKQFEEKVENMLEGEKLNEVVDSLKTNGLFQKIANNKYVQKLDNFFKKIEGGKRILQGIGIFIMFLGVVFFLQDLISIIFLFSHFNFWYLIKLLLGLFISVVLFLVGYALFFLKKWIVLINTVYYFLILISLFLNIFFVPYMEYLGKYAFNDMQFNPHRFNATFAMLIFIFVSLLFTLLYSVYMAIIVKNKDKFTN